MLWILLGVFIPLGRICEEIFGGGCCHVSSIKAPNGGNIIQKYIVTMAGDGHPVV